MFLFQKAFEETEIRSFSLIKTASFVGCLSQLASFIAEKKKKKVSRKKNLLQFGKFAKKEKFLLA